MAADKETKAIFISYSHKDKKWLEELTDFLKPLERSGRISLWIDHAKIKSGDIWKDEITKALASAQLALLLVTQQFIASDFIHREELPQLLESARTKGVKILWIAVSKSTVSDTAINAYQALNDPAKPLARFSSRAKRSEELHKIYEKIKQALESASPWPEKVSLPGEASIPEASEMPVRSDVAAGPPGQPEPEKSKAHAPSSGEQIILEETGQAPEKVITNSIGMTFVPIPADTFQMGSPSDEAGHYDDERQHQVTISKPYYLQTTPVTQGQWQKVMGSNPSSFNKCGDTCPVESVSWEDAQEFIRKLNRMENTDTYRLPTEAEWEYACRAGSTGRFCFGEDEGRLPDYAWFAENSGNKTQPVGQLKPNNWGLYDMHGNVWEWCQDWYGPYPGKPVADPQGPDAGERRVLRGGSWSFNPGDLRSADRIHYSPGNRYVIAGFRVARTF